MGKYVLPGNRTAGVEIGRVIWIVLLCLAGSQERGFAMTLSSGKSLMVVEKGRARAAIVLGVDASALERKAAEELQTYLKRIAGADLPIVSGSAATAGHRILIGGSPAAEEIVPREEAAEQGDEGFVLRSTDRDLAIVGGGDYGTLYGTYALLEKLGVRWYLPDPLGEIVPRRSTVEVGPLDEKQRPSFPMRWVGNDDEWNLRNRMNRVGPAYPPGFRIAPGIYHSQSSYIPHDRYYETHPEFFALIDGVRSKEKHAKLCVSNPELVREVARNMAEKLRADPAIDLISLSPTDGQLWCECENCRALDEAEVPRDQRYSRRMLVFYNRVAEELEKEFPDQLILTGAYNVYTLPPKDPDLKAHRNLAVIICHYEDYCLAHPTDDPECPPNARYRDLIFAWQRHTPHIYFYEYYWKVNWFDLPWPIVHTIAADMPYFKSIGVEGVFTQYTTDNIWTNLLDYYVAAKLLWDVNADVPAILDEFYTNFYREAATPMRRYYETLERAVAESPHHFPGNAPRHAHLVFTEELVEEAGRHLKEALDLARHEEVNARLEKIAISYDYTKRLSRYFRMKAQSAEEEDREGKRRILREAVDLLEEIYAEVSGDRARYDGVVSRNVVSPSVYMGKELSRMKERLTVLSQ